MKKKNGVFTGVHKVDSSSKQGFFKSKEEH